MKKHNCIICMKKKKNVQVLYPCMHIVCAKCLEKCIYHSGKICPICRTQFSETYSSTENGDLIISTKDEKAAAFNSYDYPLPKGDTLWSAHLRKMWSTLPQRIWNMLQAHGLDDTVVVSYVMSVLSSKPKSEASAIIDDFIGGLIPNFFNTLFAPTS